MFQPIPDANQINLPISTCFGLMPGSPRRKQNDVPKHMDLSPLLKRAALSGIAPVIKAYITRGGAIDARDSNGRSPLMLASMAGQTEICRMLLTAGADIDAVDTLGMDARALAVQAGHTFVAQLLDEQTDPPSADEAKPDEMALAPATADEFDLSGWESEEESVAPESDETVQIEASDTQEGISSHRPIDLDEDWSDIDVDLPDISRDRRRRRQLDREFQTGIRDLMAGALDTGWIPEFQVHELAASIEALDGLAGNLIFVLTEMGVVITEDEIGTPSDPAQDGTESASVNSEMLIDDALDLLSNLLSNDTDPLTLHVKAFGRNDLLTAEEEIALGEEMELALGDAVRIAASQSPVSTALLDLVDAIRDGSLGMCSAFADAFSSQSDHLNTDDDPEVEAASGAGDPDDGEPQGSRTDMDVLNTVRELLSSHGAPNSASLLHEALGDWPQKWQLFELARQRMLSTGAAGSSGQDSKALEDAIRRGLSARNRMIDSNVRLVFSIAKRYMRSGMELPDLVQEGNLGLMKAVEKVDFRKGFRFSTYATWWIRQTVMRAIADKARFIRLPVHMHDLVRKIIRASEQFEMASSRAPTPAEIAEVLSIPVSSVMRGLHVPDDPLSLEACPDGSPTGASLAEAVVDPAPTPEDAAASASLTALIQRTLAELPSREARVLELRFGLTDDDDHTLEEVGKKFDLTRERIRQIETKALTRLSHPARSTDLRDYLE